MSDLVARSKNFMNYFPELSTKGWPNSLRFLLWCNDHTFIVAPNLLAYTRHLQLHAGTAPVYAGKELYSGGRRFTSGAAGIILNMRTLETLTKHWSSPEDFRECFPPELQLQTNPLRKVSAVHSFGKVKEPGLLLSDCLSLAGIAPNRTRARNSTEVLCTFDFFPW